MDGDGSAPSVVPFGLIPAAGEQMILAVFGLDDLAVPVAVLLHHGLVFEAVVRIARKHVGRAPNVLGERRLKRRGEKIIDKGLAGGGRHGRCVRWRLGQTY